MCTGSLLVLCGGGGGACVSTTCTTLFGSIASHGLLLAACKLAYLHLPARYNTHKYTYTGGLCSASKVYVTYINCCRIAIHMCATPVDKDWLVKKCYIRPLLDRQNDIMITAKK